MKNEPSYYKDIRKNHIRVFLLCLCGILINYVLSKLAIILKLPIWLDTAGTILAGIYGGYLPGIFTGFVTNLLKGITDFSSIYYAVLNAANEASVYLFLNDKIKFLDIEKIIYEEITNNEYESISYNLENIIDISKKIIDKIVVRYGGK